MESYTAAVITAFWLGILTSISPCPLTTNIAAMSYMGNRVGNIRSVFMTGVFYTTGRMLAYSVVGYAVVAGLVSIPVLSTFLQRYMNMLLGPVLILVGMILLEMISLPRIGGGGSDSIRAYAEKHGLFGALILGMLFALSFCPVSAALFFGSLIPVSYTHLRAHET